MCEGHFSDDGQHDFLAFGGVGVLLVLAEPSLEGRRRLAGRVFPPRGQVVPATVPGKCEEDSKLVTGPFSRFPE